MKIWEYTNNTKIRYGRTLYQIRYISGDTLGGWIEKTCKIPQSKNIFIDSNSMIHGNVSLKGKVQVINSEIFGNTKIEDNSGVQFKDCIIFNTNFVFNQSDEEVMEASDIRFFGNGIRIDSLSKTNGISFQKEHLLLGSYDTWFVKNDRNGYSVKVGCQEHSIKAWKRSYKAIAIQNRFPEEDFNSGLKVLADAEIFFKTSEKILSYYFGNTYRENGKFAKKPTLDQVFQKRS